MAGKKISQLPALGGSFAAGDLFEISEDGGGGTYVSKKITGTEMIASIGAGTGTVTSVAIAGGTTGLTVTGSPITTAGTITIGGALVAANGGTGQTSYSTGDILYASGATAISKLAVGSNTEVLTLAGGVPTWAAPAGGGATDLDGLTDVKTTSDNSIWIMNAGAGSACTTGTLSSALDNIGIGTNALNTITSGDYNIAIGLNAGTALLSALHNVMIGRGSGAKLTSGGSNVMIGGYDTGGEITTETRNTLMGYQAGGALTSSDNTIVGDSAGTGAMSTGANTFVGKSAGATCTGGGQQNNAFGYYADAGTTGNYNVSIGRGVAGTTGSANIKIGNSWSKTNHTTGSYSIKIGTEIAATAAASYEFLLGGSARILMNGDYTTAGSAKLMINPGATVGTPTATLHVKGAGATSGTTALLVEDSTGADIIKVTDDGATEFTGQTFNTLATAVDGATVTPDFSAGNVQTLTLAGNRAIANPLNIKAGATYIIVIVQDGTGSRTISSWGSNYKFSGGTAPTLTTAANQADVITMVAYSASILMCTSTLNFATS